MLNRRLLSLLTGSMLATLFFILVYPTSYALAQNETTDDSMTTDTETTDTETTDVNPLSQGTATWRKATLGVQVDVVGGTAAGSDFTIQVTSSNMDDSIDWEQYPEIFEGGSDVTLRVSDIPSSEINYEVEVIDQPSSDYSPQYEGCRGSWELGGYKTCRITIYYTEPPPLPDFEIVANPEELTIIPESSGYSTLTLIPSQDNSRDAIIDIGLDTEWIGDTPPDNNDVSVILERESTRLVGTERQDIGVTIQTSQDAPPGQTFTLNVVAYGEVDQQQHPVSHTANIQITIPSSTNTPPEAIAVLDKEQVEEGGSVNLDGTQSSDLDGDELFYLWEIISGPANMQISDDESRESTLIFETPKVDQDAEIIFQLTVSDGKPGGIGVDRTELRIDDLGSNNNNNPNTGATSNNPQNPEHRGGPLTGAIPPEIRDAADGFIPPVVGPSNNNNTIYPLLVLVAILVIGGIALGKYKASRGRSRRLDIPPSALVEIRAKGGISR